MLPFFNIQLIYLSGNLFSIPFFLQTFLSSISFYLLSSALSHFCPFSAFEGSAVSLDRAIILSMGQNTTSAEWLSYSSRDYFQQQVELYRWRADPLSNTHISQVRFLLLDPLKDRSNLHSLLHSGSAHVALSDILRLGERATSKEEVMSFEEYMCGLDELRGRLGLEEALFCLQAMLSGYEVLLTKMGRSSAELQHCFVTQQGQVRAWCCKEWKTNQMGPNPITSEMTLIRKVVELSHQLATNSTEFLHFSRQFRSYMDRDILHNWSFSNARRLLNNYLYTYRLTLPASLPKSKILLLNSLIHSTPIETPQSSICQSQEIISLSCYSRHQAYSQVSSSRKESQRPASLSDYNKSEENLEPSIKQHSKKFSSTDLKHLQQKSCDSPKLSKSELLQSKEVSKFRNKENSLQISHEQTYRRRDRDSCLESKPYNISTDIGFSPDLNSLTHDSDCQPNGTRHKGPSPSILKQSQTNKNRKKLQKKVATISKYISYYQRDSPQYVPSESHQQSSNFIKSQRAGHAPKNTQVPTYPANPMKTSCEVMHQANPNTFIEKQYLRNYAISHHSETSQSKASQSVSSHPRMCFTVQTLNKLLNNNEVSIHESNGSFMSLEQSQLSEYHGELCKMGRSVDILNVPSGRQIQKRVMASSNQLNRSNL